MCQCCQFTDFVTRFSEFVTPLETFFKNLATKSISWTNFIYTLPWRHKGEFTDLYKYRQRLFALSENSYRFYLHCVKIAGVSAMYTTYYK